MLTNLPEGALYTVLEFLTATELERCIRPLSRDASTLFGHHGLIAIQKCLSLELPGLPYRKKYVVQTSEQEPEQKRKGNRTRVGHLPIDDLIVQLQDQLAVEGLCEWILQNMKGYDRISGAHHEEGTHWWRSEPTAHAIEASRGKRLSLFDRVKTGSGPWNEVITKFSITYSGRWGVFLRCEQSKTTTWRAWILRETDCQEIQGNTPHITMGYALSEPNNSAAMKNLDPQRNKTWTVASARTIRIPAAGWIDVCVGAVDVTEDGDVISRVIRTTCGSVNFIDDLPSAIYHRLPQQPPRIGVPLPVPVNIRTGLGRSGGTSNPYDFFYLWPVALLT